MFHARIVSPRGSLYFAAEATPYDLENLRTHVHDLQGAHTAAVRLELSFDPAGAPSAEARVTTLVSQLAAEGVDVSVRPEDTSPAPEPPPPTRMTGPAQAAPKIRALRRARR